MPRKDFKQYAESAIKAKGFTLIGEYQRSSEPLNIICENGHQSRVSWNSIQQGWQCFRCSVEYPQRKIALLHSDVESYLNGYGFKLRSEYRTARKKLDIECPNGHVFQMALYTFKAGNRCKHCTKDAPSKRTNNIDIVRSVFAERGYQLVSPYIKAKLPVTVICPEGHEVSIRYDHFKRGSGCSRCSGKNKTKEEEEIKQIKLSTLKLICSHLKDLKYRQSFGLPSKSSFAKRKAVEIYNSLGVRPDGWQLDHIIPQSWFDFRVSSQIEACWEIYNLRYLPAIDNARRRNVLQPSDLLDLTTQQLELIAIAANAPLLIKELAQKELNDRLTSWVSKTR